MGWGSENLYNYFDIRNVYLRHRKDSCKISSSFSNHDRKPPHNDLKARKRPHKDLKARKTPHRDLKARKTFP